MTETPKCPYCGAELEVTHAFVNNATAFREECAISRWIFAVIPPDVFDRPVLSEWIATDRSEKYGKEWRCWPRKPTPEQMRAEKWEV